MADMKAGMLLGLSLIYLVLAWVFGHYGWPLIIMLAIPFGLVGAVTGHWLMGIDLTILSMFGLFGLSGIVVNDSIVLVEFYRHQREKGVAVKEALINAACLRLRAILLTSLTTIGGLSTLMMEKSLQAQFLIPMATSITFGLAFTTVLALLWLPRPSSCTVTEWSRCSVTAIRLQKPPKASSAALSIASWTMCSGQSVRVYIPGRWRTGSSPLRTAIDSAV